MTRTLLLFSMVACTHGKATVVLEDEAGVTTEPTFSDTDDDDGDASPADDEAVDGADEDDPDPENEEEEEEEEEEEPGPEDRPEGHALWTIMVLLNGDNNLEENALIDMNEMEQVGSTEDVNVLVQLDRSPRYTSRDGDWSGARRYLAESDSDMNHISSEVLVDLGTSDSGAVETFVDFAEWGVENFPAQNYAYIIWDHGWSWTLAPSEERKGVSEDEVSGNDISIARGELTEILKGVTEATGEKLALLGMDACLMASWEIAAVAEPYAEIYVASQATESVDGWAYHTAMADLIADPEMSASELGTVIAERFWETDDSTQSVVDLRGLNALNNAIDSMARSVLGQADPRAAIRDFARDAQSFDGDLPDIDLGDLALLLEEGSVHDDLAEAAVDTLNELESVIVANYTNGRGYRNATGLSIYLPTNGRTNARYWSASWAELTQWDEMLSEIQD
jgi:hypothetical protein